MDVCVYVYPRACVSIQKEGGDTQTHTGFPTLPRLMQVKKDLKTIALRS